MSSEWSPRLYCFVLIANLSLICHRFSQGYAFKVITALDGMENMPGLVYSSRAEQIELLQSVLLANESDADIGTDVRPGDEDRPASGRQPASRGGPAAAATRTAGSLVALSGGQSMA